MKTESHPIEEILKNRESFFIPPFQRPYAWGKPEIDRYFSDVLKIINSEIDETEKDKKEHFFGTLVIQIESTSVTDKVVVIDGQQRLTTTSIFLLAIRDLTEDEVLKTRITNYYLKSRDSKIKLELSAKDKEAFYSLVEGKTAKSSVIKIAYDIFIAKLKKNPEFSFENYANAIKKMNVAVIQLDERPFKGEDPQIIFETLNSLGKPLTLSDLIRNYILLNMKSESQSSIYEKTWYPIIEKQLGENASEFFRDFLQLKKAVPVKVVSDNNTKEIYAEFKDFVENHYQNKSDFINDIISYVDFYRWIIFEDFTDLISEDKEKDSEIKELLTNIFHDIKTEAFKPLVLGLLYQNQTAKSISDEKLIEILKVIRTYLIRRRLSKLTQGENKEIVIMCRKIEDLTNGKVTMIKLLCSSFYKMRFPNDNDIRQILSIANFYEDFKKYQKFVLGKIEEHNTKIAIGFRNPKITIEHIMPQTLSDSWKAELGENAEEIHKKYLHNIGNLILTEFNSEIGNKTFSDKKKKLETSSMNYRLEILKNDKWNEESIKKHQDYMIKCFLETFPLPDEYKNSDNWTSKSTDSETFSPLEDDAEEIAEGNKPKELLIDTEKIKVDSWKEVFLTFLKFVKEKESWTFDMLLENQQEIWSNSEVILSYSALKSKIEKDEKYEGFYKTLDGKSLEKAKNPANEFFVYSTISARTCIQRIASVLNKIGKSKEFVNITLKNEIKSESEDLIETAE